MPDYSGLLQALAGEQQSYAQQNPWIIGGQAVLKTPVYATNETDPLQTALVQALQGLVGGFATSYGQGQAQTQADALSSKLQNALMGAQQPGGAGLADALLADSDPAVKKLGQAAYMQQLAQEAEDRSRVRKLLEEESIKAQFREPKTPSVETFGDEDIMFQGGKEIGRTKHAVSTRQGIMSETAPDTIVDQLRERYNLTPEQLPYGTSNLGISQQIQLQTKAGENIRAPNPDEIKQLSANDIFQGRIAELKKLSEGISDSNLKRMFQGGKILSFLGDPNSDDYKFYSLLKGAQQEFARTKDSGMLSVFDVKLWGPLFEGIPLFDTKKGLQERLDAILARQQEAKNITLGNLKKGNVNVENFMSSASASDTSTGPYGAKVTLKDGGTATWDGKGYKRD